VAGLQARAGIDAGLWSERSMAEIAVRSRRDAETNPNAQLAGSKDVDELLAEPYLADPLRRHDCAPITDGATVIVLAADDRARELVERPAWITGIAHRVDSAHLGARDLTVSASTAAAGADAGIDGVEVAELQTPFTHQEHIVRGALGLGDSVRITPSGGALAGNPMFAAGLTRIGEAAKHIWDGSAGRVLAHSTSGPALQHNLVCVMEGRD
jgi:acetyl-CoA acetyltransferase